MTVSASEVREIETPAAAGGLAPSIAGLDDDRLILTWLEPFAKGHALKFSVLGESGFGPARTIASGEGWFANWADTPGLFVLPGGDWVAHWLVKSSPSTYAYDVMMARSSDAGDTWSEPISPHRDGTATEHGFVSYFAASDDAVGMVWLDGRRMARSSGEEDGAAMTLRTAVVSADGSLSARMQLDDRVCDCCQTASAMTPGGPVVVYRGRSDDEIRDHHVVRRTAVGWSEPALLHADSWRIGGCPVNGPAMAADGNRVAVAWFTMSGERPLVRLAMSRDGGNTFQPVDTLGEGTALGRVDLAVSAGGFVLSWIDQPERSGVLELIGYDWGGERRWRRRIEGLDAGRASGFPRLGVVEGCRPVIAWTGREDAGTRIRVARIDAHEACAVARGKSEGAQGALDG